MELMGGLPGPGDPETGATRVLVTTDDAKGGPGPDADRDAVGGPSAPRLIDPTPALCNATMCFAESGGITYYFDDNHISATMSATLKKYFLPSIRDVVDEESDSVQ